MSQLTVAHRQVRDLDDGGRLLWVPKGKTAASRRHVEVPGVIQAPWLALAKDRPSAAYLFGCGDARPRGNSDIDFVPDDQWYVDKMLKQLSFERGRLHFHADYVRGRLVRRALQSTTKEGSLSRPSTAGRR